MIYSRVAGTGSYLPKKIITNHGVRLWVFRERTEPHQWFLHGVFG